MNTEKILASVVNWFSNRPKTSGYLLSIILIFFIILTSEQQSHMLNDDKKNEMNIILNDIHEGIDQSLKNCQSTITSLALTIDDNGIPQNFDIISKQLMNSNPDISSVRLAPLGVVKYIYPLKGNEATINFNVFDSKFAEGANKSLKTKKGYFEGPLKLKQDEIVFLARLLPVYKKNIFWGFTAATINLKNLLNASGANSIDSSKYSFQFSKTNPITQKEEFYLPTKIDLAKNNYITHSIPNSLWKIYLIEKKTHSLFSFTLFIAILGLILSILLGIFTTKLLKKPEELRLLLKNQEIKLLKNEMKFRTILEQATIGFAIIDSSSFDFIEANNKYCNMLGYTFDEIKEKGIAKLTHPDDVATSLQNLKNLEEGNIKEYSSEKRYINKSGEIVWVNLNVSPLWENNKKPTAYIAFIKDITEKKEAEALIAKSQARFKSLIDTIDGIVWEYNLETMSSSFISKKVENILGYTIEDYKGSPTFWEDHIYSEDREFALGISTIVNKKYTNHDYEYRMVTKQGKVIWIRDIVNFVFENGKPIMSGGIMIDITIMKEAEKDLNNSFNLVTEQNKRLLNFSYIVSHNLRSHTSNIESIISLIESAESEDERIEMMHLLKSVSNSLDETMIHLNEVVNINTNISLVIKPLDLSHYINKAQEVLSEQIQLNKASFIIDVPEDELINYNSAYLESILYNLISNAIRYKHPQRKPIITIKLYKEKDENVIEVTDNGIGIDLNKNGDKIFGMYKTFSNNSDARGIGLFITKNQIDAMGGNITVESKPNIGTTFKIYTK